MGNDHVGQVMGGCLRITDAVVCMGLGALTYHMYAKLRNLERLVLANVEVVSIGGEFEVSDGDDAPDARRKFGFTSGLHGTT